MLLVTLHVYVSVYICICVYMCVCIHIHTYECICTHIHIYLKSKTAKRYPMSSNFFWHLINFKSGTAKISNVTYRPSIWVQISSSRGALALTEISPLRWQAGPTERLFQTSPTGWLGESEGLEGGQTQQAASRQSCESLQAQVDALPRCGCTDTGSVEPQDLSRHTSKPFSLASYFSALEVWENDAAHCCQPKTRSLYKVRKYFLK